MWRGESGDDGLSTFCESEFPRLVRSLGLYTGDVHLAEDLAQETLARVVRDWDRVRRMERPGAYAHRIAMNLANSHYRRQRIARRARSTAAAGHASEYNDPDVAAVLSVRTAVRALPRRRRQIIVLRFVGELTLPEIAAALNVGLGTVKSELHHALSCLKESLSVNEPAQVG